MIPSRRVVIRCDGGTTVGMGHIVRCVALAEMLRAEFEILFALRMREPSACRLIRDAGFDLEIMENISDTATDATGLLRLLRESDIVVLDGYDLRTEYQGCIRSAGYTVVAIDDVNDWHHVADVVINHGASGRRIEYDIAAHTRLLSGADYALLRPRFLRKNRPRKHISKVKRCMISMGASDANGRTMLFAAAVQNIPGVEELHLLVSDLNPHLDTLEELRRTDGDRVTLYANISEHELADLIGRCDVALCPASTISLEVCSVGCALLTGYTARNQLILHDGLVENQVAGSLGDLNAHDVVSATRVLETAFADVAALNGHTDRQSMFLDGLSAQRILRVFRQLPAPRNRAASISRRRAVWSDADLYFRWANDPAVRRNSFNSDPIEWREHLAWFRQSLESSNTVLLLFLLDEEPFGQVRLRIEDKKAIVNYSVAEKFRGMGLSHVLLDGMRDEIISQFERIEVIEGVVKPENETSAKSFRRCGYRYAGGDHTRHVFVLELPWRSNQR